MTDLKFATRAVRAVAAFLGRRSGLTALNAWDLSRMMKRQPGVRTGHYPVRTESMPLQPRETPKPKVFEKKTYGDCELPSAYLVNADGSSVCTPRPPIPTGDVSPESLRRDPDFGVLTRMVDDLQNWAMIPPQRLR